MSYYTEHRNKKILNRIRAFIVFCVMLFLIIHVSEAGAGEMKNPNLPVWMTIDGDRVQIPVGVAKKLVEASAPAITTEDALTKKKLKIIKHASVDVDDNAWILKAPMF